MLLIPLPGCRSQIACFSLSRLIGQRLSHGHRFVHCLAGHSLSYRPEQVSSADFMAPASSLGNLLESSELLAAHVLGALALKELAAVVCTSRGLRAAAARQPESLWQARLYSALHRHLREPCLTPASLQAAAQRDLGAFHPVCSVPDVRAYLRMQHATRQQIVSGAAPVPARLQQGLQSCISPSFAKLATLGEDGKLVILDASTGRLLRQRKLPQVVPWRALTGSHQHASLCTLTSAESMTAESCRRFTADLLVLCRCQVLSALQDPGRGRQTAASWCCSLVGPGSTLARTAP